MLPPVRRRARLPLATGALLTTDYHFSSKGDLVRSVVGEAVAELTAFLNEAEHDPDDPRAIFEGFFDLRYAHRDVLRALIFDPTAMAHLDHTDFMPHPSQQGPRSRPRAGRRTAAHRCGLAR